jgi:hypothetical protein
MSILIPISHQLPIKHAAQYQTSTFPVSAKNEHIAVCTVLSSQLFFTLVLHSCNPNIYKRRSIPEPPLQNITTDMMISQSLGNNNSNNSNNNTQKSSEMASNAIPTINYLRSPKENPRKSQKIKFIRKIK